MSDQSFVILSPACDLVIRRNGKSNTDYILLVEVESMNEALDGSRSRSKVREIVNNRCQYLHWLPQTDFFQGGVLNFRKLKTLHKNDFEEQFEDPAIQISPFFIKDIVSRFSSFYARQGQPDIDSDDFVASYTQQQS